MSQLLMHMHRKLVIALRRFMARMRVQKLEVETFHEPAGSSTFQSRVCGLSATRLDFGKSSYVHGRDPHPKLEVEAPHELSSRIIAQLANSAMILGGRFMVAMRERLLVEATHEPMVEYRVAEENATRVAFSSAHRFKAAMRVQKLEVETSREPDRASKDCGVN
ncbi:MAG: hypothetical protein FJ388_10235 [Verrucomicrobia bacterium]|nr:hypothetical protein [Verrucomicrobiota bacterium]